MTWQVELTVEGAVDQAWSCVSDEGLFYLWNNLLLEADKEGWRGQLAWWPSGQKQGEWADQEGGTHAITPGLVNAE